MSHQEAEFGKQEALYHELSDSTAAVNISIYLQQEGLSDTFSELSLAHKRVIFDVPLRLQLDKPHIPDHPETERDEIIASLERQNLLPKDREEAAAALPPGIILATLKPPKLSHTKEGKELAFNKAKALFEDAESDERAFGEIGVRRIRGESRLTPAWLRESRQGQYLIADGLMAKESLNQGDWPEPDSLQYFERQSYWRGFMLLAAEYASDETLKDTMKFFFAKNQARLSFASKQQAMAGHRIGKHMLHNGAVRPEDKELWTEANGSATSPVAEVHQLDKYRTKALRAEHLAEQNGGVMAAEMRELGGNRAIRNQAGDVVTTEEPDDQPSAEQLVRHELEAKERRRKRFAKRR